MQVEQFIAIAGQRVQQIVAQSTTPSGIVIARYTVAIAGNFQKWLGYTNKPRNNYADYAVKSNLTCEMLENHEGMLNDFAKACRVNPSNKERDQVGEELTSILLRYFLVKF